MPNFGNRSKSNLEDVNLRLVEVCNDAIKTFDFSVLCGHRNEEDQNKAFAEHKSTLRYPNSNHNKKPSDAVDLAPYPIDWNDKRRFYNLASIMFIAANRIGIILRWGGDWDRDASRRDQSFNDLPHFEYKGEATEEDKHNQIILANAYNPDDSFA